MDPDIALFVDVVRAGSLSGAGRARNISAPMVSKRIARLEARLGVRLLNRTTRRLALTPRGEIFHDEVARLIDALAAAEARIRDTASLPSGPLRVSAPTSFGRLHLAPRLAPFLAAHEQVELELNLSDGFEDLIAARVDLAVRITSSVPRHLAFERLADSPRILCASPDYLAARGPPAGLDDLGRHHLLAADGQLPWQLTGPEGDVMVNGTSRVRTNSSEVVRELALAGAGIALRSIWDIHDALAERRIVRILPDYRGSNDVAIYAVHDGKPGPAAAAFLLYLRRLWPPEPPWSRLSP